MNHLGWLRGMFPYTVAEDLQYNVFCKFLFCFHVHRNAGDSDKVWTFGSGPRQCIGVLLSNTILKVSIHIGFCIWTVIRSIVYTTSSNYIIIHCHVLYNV